MCTAFVRVYMRVRVHVHPHCVWARIRIEVAAFVSVSYWVVGFMFGSFALACSPTRFETIGVCGAGCRSMCSSMGTAA